jgi:hypothetical protein
MNIRPNGACRTLLAAAFALMPQLAWSQAFPARPIIGAVVNAIGLKPE